MQKAKLGLQVLSLFTAIALTGSALSQSVMAEEAARGPLKDGEPGYYAYQVLKHLSSEIGSRAAGSEEESAAGAYILQGFKKLGMTAELQPFEYQFAEDGELLHSANVVATKPGLSTRVVYVGGHYDSVEAGKGADDNASGIGVMLEAAQALSNVETPYTIKFIAFGAEEVGLIGSEHYVSGMTAEEIDNAVAMINLDSLAVGDDMLIYGNSGTDGFVRELGLDIAERLELDVSTQTGLNPLYPAGTTIDASDHVPFKYAGIPYGYLESTNWALGEMDGYTQTEKDGEVWHTEKDTLAFISENYPGRIEEHLSTFTQLLIGILLEIEEPTGPAFHDLGGVPWADEAIGTLASMDMVIGDGYDRFEPSKTVTRAEMATMLVRALGLLDPYATVDFDDVQPDDWHYSFIASFVDWGLAQGVGNGKFDPNGTITREQMAAMGASVLMTFTDKLVANADDSLARYRDRSDIAAYARDSIALLTEQGVMQGVADGTFDPKGAVTRAQAAVMIYKLLGYE
ncbi:M20/M25/M40 family metallo-hydrolase [Paenibacillus sp. LHD-117]|uniref:M20/M25/M40 family metallo-hydrolase n=1 Tax=Paenibacillus sp. LHD-117 TaxID=3071412 RepID=UPI0027E1D954|nr:M20/M25/M40 family metallo-hydrolase [Paenibacillus sp. LHD-117]MDQ6423441.1 M20/M25/M40 family metallo-hydrolase [Paenibacillus sp. LHD-117]